MVCIISPVPQNLLTYFTAHILKWRGDLLILDPTLLYYVVLKSHLDSLLRSWCKFETFILYGLERLREGSM